MYTKDSNLYDILANGLGGAKDYQEFVDTMFADKYNVTALPDDFSWESEMQINFSYEQLQAELGVYAMATIVDINSPGPKHATQGATISTGNIPRFKHGFDIDEKTIREKALMLKNFGGLTQPMREALANVMFNSTDKLLGGNYNLLTYMRHQAISTGQYAVTSTNNPGGIANLTFDFGIPAANKKKAGGFGSNGTKYVWTDLTNSNPLGDLQDMVRYAKVNNIPVGAFEMSEALYTDFISHPKVKAKVALFFNLNADITNAASMLFPEESYAAMMRGLRLPPIKVIDSVTRVEKYDEATRTIGFTELRPFDEAVVVLRPSGQLGTIKAVEPLPVADPAARIAYYDNGRTILKQTFDIKTNIQSIESELTALVVPNTSKYILQLTTDEAAS